MICVDGRGTIEIDQSQNEYVERIRKFRKGAWVEENKVKIEKILVPGSPLNSKYRITCKNRGAANQIFKIILTEFR